MRSFLGIIGLVFFCSNAFSQNVTRSKYDCLYEYSVKSEKGDTDVLSTILQLGDSYARFMDYSAFQLDSVAQIPNVPEEVLKEKEMQMVKNDMFFDQTIYQNSPKNLISVHSMITPNYYTYQEDKNKISWSLTEETDHICGYLCKKAMGEYGGRSWIVWYTPEIPVPFGPWKLSGLPGLIMAAFDSENIHHFTAIQFREGSTPITSPNYPNEISTSREKFIKTKNLFEKNPMSNIPKESISDITVRKSDNGKGLIFINGVQLRLRPNGYTPLELE